MNTPRPEDFKQCLTDFVDSFTEARKDEPNLEAFDELYTAVIDDVMQTISAAMSAHEGVRALMIAKGEAYSASISAPEKGSMN